MSTTVISLPELSVGDINGAIKTEGLSIAGLITEVQLNSATWTALPATPLALRNAICIQNESGIQIKIGYDNTEPGYIGITINDGGERFYNITPDIIIYAKSEKQTPTVTVEELS
jgi:hypothetical protein